MIIKNLRESRERLDLKQIDVAKIFPVANSTVSGWETGKDTIPLKNLIKYANYYNYSLDYLFGLSNKKEITSTFEIDKKDMQYLYNIKKAKTSKRNKQYDPKRSCQTSKY